VAILAPAGLFCGGLFLGGESLGNLSVYIGDARKQELPLANLFGGDPIHDWNYLLGSVDRLQLDIVYAMRVRFLGILCVLAFLWIGGWLLRKIWAQPGKAGR
jgi:hypothetical protein